MAAYVRPCLIFAIASVLLVSTPDAFAQQSPTPDAAAVDFASELPRIPATPPDRAVETLRVAEGFRAELVAAEPLVRSPVAMAFDENGRLFVVEMRDYSEEDDEFLGAVRMLSDDDGDGRFDRSDVYAEGLSWPTAIACWNGGVLVAAPPQVFYLRDENGDGKSDTRETVFDGFGRSNVQGLVNSFRWGLDNRIWGATSSSGADVASRRRPEAPVLSLRRRDFAIEPRGMTIAPASGGGQHGQSFDAFGRRYVCSNSDHLQLIMFEDRYVARNPFLVTPAANRDVAADGPQAPVFRASPVEPWRIVRTRLRVQGLVPGPVEGGGAPAGYFTGATGATIYLGDAFPAEYRGDAFIGDAGGNLVHRKNLADDGLLVVGRRTDEGQEFLASTDIWFRPVQMANAPDGALYVLDMSRETIEHPQSLPPAIKQHLDLTSGRDQGRIYRIVPDGFRQRPTPRMGDLSAVELVPFLEHPNGWHRETAARLIYKRQDVGVAAALEELAASSAAPEGRVHAMGALDGLDKLRSATVIARLRDEHPRVREHAVRLAEGFVDDPEIAEALFPMAGDADVRVRYQLAFTLGEFDDPQRIDALVAIAKRDAADSWMRLAVQSSLVRDAGVAFAKLGQSEDGIQEAGVKELTLALARQIGAQGMPDDLASAFEALHRVDAQDPAFARRLLRALATASGDRARFADALRAAGAEAARSFDETVAESTRLAQDSAASATERIEAIRALRAAPFESTRPALGKLLDARQPDAVQLAALGTLADYDDPAAADLALGRFGGLSPAVKAETLEALLSRPAWIALLLDRLEAKSFPAAELDSTRRRFLLEHPDAAVARRAAALFARSTSDQRAAVLATYRQALETPGQAERGREVFKTACSACHRLEGVGFEIGKDLKGIGARGAETILANVLDPNREVDPAYLNYVAAADSGRVYSGIVAAESATSLTLKRASDASDTLLRSEIETLKSSGVSIMPEGLEKQIDVQAMADLLAYLQSLP